MITELIAEVVKRIEATEGRSRSRDDNAQASFEYAVALLLIDLWKSVHSIPDRECSISKRSGYYSEQPRYRNPALTYKQTMAAYEGLLRLDFIEVTQEGYFDRLTGTGRVTRFRAKDELLEMLFALDGHPAITVPRMGDGEVIILRDKVQGKRQLKDYEDTPATEQFRSNLNKINACLLRHWADLEVQDASLPELARRVANHQDKEPIDFSQRTLVRIFTNGSFEEGGRFYRGWWQNIPSEYRKFITLNQKRTAEVDFSQLNPHLLYQMCGRELGSEDAYSRVLHGEHRKLVKQAFNAMVQASSFLKSCPATLDLSMADIGWADLRDAILAAHRPIADQFFQGVGNKLQFKDSCIAERVMLQFAEMDAPALPVHDSFIVHHGYAWTGEIEEIMRRAYFEEMGQHISKVDTEILSWSYRKPEEEPDKALSITEILAADDDLSGWRKRHEIWQRHVMNQKHYSRWRIA